MREIKFRAWDNLSPKMYTGHSVSIGASGSIAFLENNGNWIEPNEGRIEIMQYTGMKDKKGIEIYEGDIVKTPLATLKTMFNYYFVEYNNEVGAFVKRYKNTIGFVRIEIRIGGTEVVGNIYENPELLTQ